MLPKRVAIGARGGEAVPSFTLTTGSRKDPPVTAAGDGTPRTPEWSARVSALEEQQRKSSGNVKSWFDDEFLQRALDERLFPLATRTYPANPTPTLFVMVGPASCGKSSAKRLIPGMTDVVNVDVDEVKLYGNAELEKHPHSTKPGVMLSDVEGIQFKYPEVLAKLRDPVFHAATVMRGGNYKNIILDTTGGMTDIIKTYIRTAKSFGYTVKVIIVYSDRQSCVDRVERRNRELRTHGEETRYIPPPVIGSIYDGFMKNRIALFYALDPRMIETVDELILVDNRGAIARIIATRTKGPVVVISPDGEGGGGADSLLDRPGAFYGLTIQTNPPGFVDPTPPSKRSKGGDSSRKRRIITRRRRDHYTKKTIKNRRYPRSRSRRRRCHN